MQWRYSISDQDWLDFTASGPSGVSNDTVHLVAIAAVHPVAVVVKTVHLGVVLAVAVGHPVVIQR